MVKEILIYGPMYSFTVTDIIKEMEDAKDGDINIRINTPGGDPYASFGLVAKYKEFPNKKTISIDGRADSAGAFLICYADAKDVSCLDVTKILFHRAAYPNWFESNPDYFNDSTKKSLIDTNNDLRAAMEGKFTAEQWEKVTGTTLDDLFSLDQRLDVEISAQQAKKLGLIKNIIKITPEKRAEIESLTYQVAAINVPKLPNPAPKADNSIENKIPKKMTVEQLKSDHPETYKATYDAGVSAERDRVGSFMAFNDIDPEAVAKGIKDGSVLSATTTAEFHRKAMNANALSSIAADSAKPVETSEVPVSGKDAKASAEAKAFDSEVDRILGIKKA